MGSALTLHSSKLLSAYHNIIKELMAETLPKNDEEKAAAI